MPWAVTLQINDCTNNMGLAFATINDGFSFFSADANGQFVAVIGDQFTGYVVQVTKANYIAKNFVFDKSQQGKVQTMCLNPAPPTPPGGGGTGCFIVSATTGSAQSDEVVSARALRDRVRGASTLAGQLIDAIYRDYEQFSPAIAAELEQDDVSRQGVLWIVVKPLLAWYALAGNLGLQGQNEAAVRAAVQDVAEACPRYLGPASIAAMLELILSGGEIPADAPDLLREFAPKIREATRYRFASWGILEPLTRVWTAAAEGRDVVDEVAEWLASAPVDAFDVSDASQLTHAELEALSAMLAFRPAARRRLGERLLEAWPDARPALANTLLRG